MADITEHFFCDTRGQYGRGQRLSERQLIEQAIDALIAKKWSDPDRRNEIDDEVACLRKQLRALDEDVPP